MLDWITVDEKYLDHLRSVDKHVPNTDYGPNHLKPFFGVLFETDKYAYVTQVSHPQPKHNSMKSSLIMLKVFDATKLLCIVNLNHMFPVPKTGISIMEYKDIEQYRAFSSAKERNNYVALLKKEMSIMRNMGIEGKSKKLYRLCCDYPAGEIAKHCINFKALEEACDQYYGLKK